jgi:hypothetical protein
MEYDVKGKDFWEITAWHTSNILSVTHFWVGKIVGATYC